jgi:hypothetical protein
VALELLPGAGHTPCAHVTLGLCLRVGHIPAHMWRLGYASVSGTSQRTCGAWALASVLGTPCAHMAFGLLPVGWALPSAHVALKLHLVSHDWVPLGTNGAWVMALDSKGMDWASEPMINGFSVRIQFY